MDAAKRAWMYAGLAFAPGVGLVRVVREEVPLRPHLGPGARLLVIGDGMAAGLAAPLGQIARDSRMTLKVDARAGSRIEDWAKMPWIKADLTSRPAVTLIVLGTNDLAPARTAPPEKTAIGAILKAIVDAGSYPIWIAPPKLPKELPGARAVIENAPIEVFPSASLDLPRGPDGVHPTARGYAGWAGAAWKTVARPRPIA